MLTNLRTNRTLLALIVPALILPLSSPVAAQRKPGAGQTSVSQDTLDRLNNEVRLAPDRACANAGPAIERYLLQAVNQYGLMDNIDETVFGQSANSTRDAGPTGYAALMARTRNETAQRYADTQAVYRAQESGGQVPVENRTAQVPDYETRLQGIAATNRINGGLECSGNAQVGSLSFPVSYRYSVSPYVADGWISEWRNLPRFDEAGALATGSPIRIAYGDALLTLDDARTQAAEDAVEQAAAQVEAAQRALAEDEYANSAAGRAEAQHRRQQAITRARACEQNGGTWGVNVDGTILRTDPQEDTSGWWFEPGCYFLGR